jgi:sigma-B regulation protein RsbU (phosphoserine phosphatase)
MVQVLIVDDDIATRALLRRGLSKQGYQVLEAADGREGIDQALHHQPSVIICDWMMPQVDGLEVCRQVKANPVLSSTYFILLTTRGDTASLVTGLDAGADDFLSKPIEISELNARVRAGLRVHQLTKDLQVKNRSLEQLTEDLQAQKLMLEGEFYEAAEYVRSLLPPPMVTKNINIDARFVPSRQLGGDCFDYYWLDPDFLAVYLLDVSGHGLGATLLSVAVLNLLRSQSLPGVNFYRPNQVLDALNETFQMSEQNEKYFTIWYGVYNRVKHQLVYSSAGHPPPLLLMFDDNAMLGTPTQVKQLKIPGIPIGMLPDTHFMSAQCDIDSASTLYVFSDGIYEISTGDCLTWGFSAFAKLLSQVEGHAHDLDRILQQIHNISIKDPLEDDLSLLQVKFTGVGNQSHQ